MNKADLSVVIPAYNEENIIVETLTEVSAYFAGNHMRAEVLVVDDGSTDRTAALVEEYARSHENIRCVRLSANLGKGGAIKRGVEEAKGERILFMDADHSVSINHLDIFIKELEKGCDIVIASIELKGASIHDVHHSIRRWAGKIAKILIRLFAVHGSHDTQRGFKLFTRTAAKQLFSKLSILRWGFDIEILVMAQKRNMKIREMPVVWHNKKVSSIGIRDYVRTFLELMQISFNLLSGRYR